MDQELAELNQKIDALTAQVAYLAEQAHISELERQSREDLLETMMPVAKLTLWTLAWAQAISTGARY